VALEHPGARPPAPFRIAVPRLARIANFDDLDPLKLEPGVSVEIVQPGRAIPPCDLVILPGSKSTMADLAFLRAQGWDIDIAAHVRRGGHVLGLCGGFQMLGRMISDPDGIEGQAGSAPASGCSTSRRCSNRPRRWPMSRRRPCRQPTADQRLRDPSRPNHRAGLRPPLRPIDGRPDGATAPGGRVVGTYLHGCFAGDAFRRAFLEGIGAASGLAFDEVIDATLDGLAATSSAISTSTDPGARNANRLTHRCFPAHRPPRPAGRPAVRLSARWRAASATRSNGWAR
jgi:adenosylcobyric acid synthase